MTYPTSSSSTSMTWAIPRAAVRGMDTELYENHDFDTPNILKLASESMTFTQAYASAANCAPS